MHAYWTRFYRKLIYAYDPYFDSSVKNVNHAYSVYGSYDIIPGKEIILNKNTYKREGYSFLEWYVKRSDGNWYCYTDSTKQAKAWTNRSSCEKFGYVSYKEGDTFKTLPTVTANGYDYDYTLYAQFEKSKFTLKFESGGGTGNMTPQQIIYGVETPIKANEFKKEGYKFEGWRAERDDGTWYCYTNTAKTTKSWVDESVCKTNGYYLYSNKQNVSGTAHPGKSTTMNARWLTNRYNIKYNANGGKGNPMYTQYVTLGVKTNLTPNTYTRDGYTFAGWRAKIGSDLAYCYTSPGKQSFGWTNQNACDMFGYYLFKDKQEILNLAGNKQTITMTAYWIPNNFRVVFDANGGSGTMSDQQVTHGVKTNLNANKFTKVGYDFDGWWAQRADGTWYCSLGPGNSYMWTNEKNCYEHYLYKDKNTVSQTAPKGSIVTMHAQWKTNQFTVSFYPNGGSGSMPDQKVTYGVGAELNPNRFTRSGYKFLGWYAQSSDGTWYCYTDPAQQRKAWTNNSTCGSFGHVLYKDRNKVVTTVQKGGLVRMVAQWKRV